MTKLALTAGAAVLTALFLPAEQTVARWQWTEQRNATTGNVTYSATLKADSVVNAGISTVPWMQLGCGGPGSGKNSLTIVTTALMEPSALSSVRAEVRYQFDSMPATLARWPTTEGALVLAAEGDSLISRMRSASRMSVEVPFRGYGRRLIRFSVAGVDSMLTRLAASCPKRS